MDLNCTGVIGAGVMGVGVAQNLAQTGSPVILVDIDDVILEKAKLQILQNVRFQGMFDDKQAAFDPEEVLSLIRFTTDLKTMESADFIVENVVEKWEVKQSVYERLSAVCQPQAIFAANTSAISITRIAAATDRPDKVIGIHFMNPVALKTMVEVIRGYHTSQETLEITKTLLERMGKESIVVNDYPGFVSNRVLMLTVNEAIFLVQDGVAHAEDVDRIFKGCFGHKMGPLETADLIGLDTILYSLDVLYDSYNDSKFRPSPLLKKMVDAGLHGRKSGQGFYSY